MAKRTPKKSHMQPDESFDLWMAADYRGPLSITNIKIRKVRAMYNKRKLHQQIQFLSDTLK